MYIQAMFLVSKTEDNHIISQNVVGIIKVKRGYSGVCHHAAYINGEAMGGYRGVGGSGRTRPHFSPPFPPAFWIWPEALRFSYRWTTPPPPTFRMRSNKSYIRPYKRLLLNRNSCSSQCRSVRVNRRIEQTRSNHVILV